MTAFGAPTCTAWATLNTWRDTRSTYRHRLELAAEQDIDIHEAWAAQHVTATSPVGSPKPVLNLQSRYARELRDVVGDAHRIDGAGMRRNQHVVGADRSSLLLQGDTD